MAEMGLSGVAIATRSIEVPGGSTFAVRGLSLVDLTKLYQLHGGELGVWFERFIVGDNDQRSDVADAISSVIASAPHLVARAVAFASGDRSDEAAAIAEQLPLGTQVAALSAIGEMTFTEEMPPKKVLEIVIRMATNLVGPATVSPPGDGAI